MITKTEIDAIVNLHKEGLSVAQIRQRLALSRQTVSRVIENPGRFRDRLRSIRKAQGVSAALAGKGNGPAKKCPECGMFHKLQTCLRCHPEAFRMEPPSRQALRQAALETESPTPEEIAAEVERMRPDAIERDLYREGKAASIRMYSVPSRRNHQFRFREVAAE